MDHGSRFGLHRLLAILAAALVVTLSACGDHRAPASAAPSNRDRVMPVALTVANTTAPLGANRPIAPWLKQHFAIFRTSQHTRVMSLSHLMFEDEFAWRHLGLNFAQARFVHTGTGLPGSGPGGPPGVWVVPGSRGVCVMNGPGVGGTCSGPGEPAPPDSGGLRFVAGDLHAMHIVYGGLVPDGNRSVSIVLANGTTKTVLVVANVYSITVKGRAVSLTDKDRAGHREKFRLSLKVYEF